MREDPSTASAPAGEFLHHAFFYDDVDEYVEVSRDFVTEGLEGGAAVLVAAPTDRLALLRDALPAAPDLRLVDMTESGRNPARIIPLWHEFVADNPRRGLRGIGEPVWSARSAAELAECERHERLLNLAFEGTRAFALMCPYDVGGLSAAVLESARRAHPLTYTREGLRQSASFVGTPSPSDDFDLPLDPAPPNATSLAFAEPGLGDVRRLVSDRASAAGLAPHRVADVVVAVNEAATNSLRHGGGSGVLRVWSAADRFICEIADSGRVGQALAGRLRADAHASGGRGLWLVHQLCDLVELRSGAAGTTVRMSVGLPV